MECPLPTKYSFPRALKEVAPEMVVFLGNHVLCIKNLVIKLIYMHTKLYIFAKKCILKNMSVRTFHLIFCGSTLPKTTLQKPGFPHEIGHIFVRVNQCGPALF